MLTLDMRGSDVVNTAKIKCESTSDQRDMASLKDSADGYEQQWVMLCHVVKTSPRS